MPAQVRGRSFANAETTEGTVTAISGECRAGPVACDQALFVRGCNQAHQRAERFGRRCHFQNRAETDPRGRGFELGMLAARMSCRLTRPRSRVERAVGNVLRIAQHAWASRRRLQAREHDRRVETA